MATRPAECLRWIISASRQLLSRVAVQERLVTPIRLVLFGPHDHRKPRFTFKGASRTSNRGKAKMTAVTETKNSNHTLQPKLILGFTLMFLLVLTALVTMFVIAVISVG